MKAKKLIKGVAAKGVKCDSVKGISRPRLVPNPCPGLPDQDYQILKSFINRKFEGAS